MSWSQIPILLLMYVYIILFKTVWTSPELFELFEEKSIE